MRETLRVEQCDLELQLGLVSGVELQRRLWQLRRQRGQRLRDQPDEHRATLQRLWRRVSGQLRVSGGPLRVRQQQRLRVRTKLLQRRLHRYPQRQKQLRRLRHSLRRQPELLQRHLPRSHERHEQLRQLRPRVREQQQSLQQQRLPLHQRRALLRLLPVLLKRLSHAALVR